MADPAAPSFPIPASAIVGRDRELVTLRAALAAALAGRGSLVLIGGEAGIGKTALAEALCHDAAEAGATVLVGRCYDLSETPPYWPWAEALARAPRMDGLRPPPDLSGMDSAPGVPTSQAALFAHARDYLAALAAVRPLVLLLEDLHWADPASLDLLRVVSRDLAEQPLLLLATYRADEVAGDHPLSALIPALVRESRAARLDLRSLDIAAIGALVTTRYALADAECERLTAYLAARTEGNALFLNELLRTLEGEGLLRPAGDRWLLGNLAAAPVPSLLRQVIAARAARLGAETGRWLAVAAVIGQEVPFALWAALVGEAEEVLLAVVARAAGARLLEERPDGMGARFIHALIREALYEGLAPSRRRALHRRAGGVLATLTGSEPDVVAHHFGRAGDPRAVEWLVRAGLRARRTDAWLTAAARFVAAAALLDGEEGRARERGWLLFAGGVLLKFADSAGALRLLDAAESAGLAADDRALAAYAVYHRGVSLYAMGAVERSLAALRQGVDALDALPREYHRWSSEGVALATIATLFPDAARAAPPPIPRVLAGAPRSPQRGVLINRLGMTGRHREALAMGEPFVAAMAASLGDGHLRLTSCLPAYMGLGHAHAALGRPDDARQMFTVARRHLAALGEPAMEEYALWADLLLVAVPYHADDPGDRAELAAAAARAWEQARVGSTSATYASPADLHLALLGGRWDDMGRLAREVWGSRVVLEHTQEALSALAMLARLRGEPELAWAWVRELHLAGPLTVPGDCDFPQGLALQATAAALALDAGDLPLARAWLAAHGRWLAWSGAVLWRAEHRLLRARLAWLAAKTGRARHHAAAAARLAGAPRQPLALLAACRLLGELDTAEGEYVEAATHLAEALALARACDTPYEQALTLLALVELRLATGARDGARATLAEARAILEPLGARPALVRAATLDARLAAVPAGATPAYPAGLTAREVEVLRLLAAGRTNREIAASLSLSPNTIFHHVTHILNKTGANNRAAAAAFALRHGLDEADDDRR